jgi:hypothetical protein
LPDAGGRLSKFSAAEFWPQSGLIAKYKIGDFIRFTCDFLISALCVPFAACKIGGAQGTIVASPQNHPNESHLHESHQHESHLHESHLLQAMRYGCNYTTACVLAADNCTI